MSVNYLTLGATPPAEHCLQVGSPNYSKNKASKECQVYLELLKRVMGPEPKKARLAVKCFQHDFGAYLEVVCYYDPDDDDSVDYAFKCEAQGPLNWDREALEQLALSEVNY